MPTQPPHKTSRFRNLRAYVLLLICAAIPIVILTGTFGFYVTQTQREALDVTIMDKAERLSLALSRELSTQIQLLSILSESPRLDPPIQNAEFAELSQRLLARVPTWQTLRVTLPDGRIVLTVPEAVNKRSYPRVVDEGSHAEMVRSAKPVIGRLLIGPRGTPAFPVRVPVIRGGQVVYGLSSVIRPKALARIVSANGLPSDWLAWITDGAGNLVYASFDDGNRLTGHTSEAVKIEPTSGQVYVAHMVDGRDVMATSARISGTDWTIALGMPTSDYSKAYGRGLAVLVLTGLATLALAAAAAVLFLRELDTRRRDQQSLESWQRVDALGKLAGGVAHDLNNLLMVFQSGADSIARRPGDPQRVTLVLDAMRQAVLRGKELTKRLLSFSRRSNAEAVTVDLLEQIEVLKDVSIQASQELVTVEFEYPPLLWPVRIDLQGLETALINLVTNAREAMSKGGLVKLSFRRVTDLAEIDKRLQGPGVAISVSDEGMGVLPEDIDRIVEPFYTTKPDAAGLGLSQVGAFARRSGGSLIVNSVSGRGSVFTILLPRDPAVKWPAVKTFGVESLPPLVLVVDDTSSSLAAARQTLEDAGVKTLAATGARMALDILVREPVKGVLTDIRMPGMSGLDLLRDIRKSEPNLPIVLMTGFSEAVEHEHSVDAPVVMKPFDLTQLCQAFATARQRSSDQKVVSFRRP